MTPTPTSRRWSGLHLGVILSVFPWNKNAMLRNLNFHLAVYCTGVKLQSWRAAVSAGFLVVLSTLGSFKSLIGQRMDTTWSAGLNWQLIERKPQKPADTWPPWDSVWHPWSTALIFERWKCARFFAFGDARLSLWTSSCLPAVVSRSPHSPAGVSLTDRVQTSGHQPCSWSSCYLRAQGWYFTFFLTSCYSVKRLWDRILWKSLYE